LSTPTGLGVFENTQLTRRHLYAIVMLSALAVVPCLVWPRLRGRLLATDFLPHLYCYMRNPGLVWTHVAADMLIGIAYLAISVTLGYLVHKARRDTTLLSPGSFWPLGSSLLLAAVLTSWKC